MCQRSLDYISSAGIRVLTIMDKELKNNNQLILTGMNEIVREIIENTGLIG
ncbi:MAG: STAS domain-containing protein [Candidatus Riflebacteria bacterium]|nr:STAS domain-containing protein [Candidatus Riflebacteria bacterium]